VEFLELFVRFFLRHELTILQLSGAARVYNILISVTPASEFNIRSVVKRLRFIIHDRTAAADKWSNTCTYGFANPEGAMRLLVFLLLSTAFCALPPGYEEELYCPPGMCLKSRYPPLRPGMTGRRSMFFECCMEVVFISLVFFGCL